MSVNLLKNKKVQFSFRVAITLAILFALIRYTDWSAFWRTLQHSRVEWVVAALGLNLIQQLVMVFTLMVVLRNKGHRPKFWPMYKVILSTFFVAKFIPTSLGLDALRIYGVSKLTGDVVSAASSMVMVRILGVFSSLFFAMIAVILGGYLYTGNTMVVIIMLFVILSAGLMVGASEENRKRIGQFLHRFSFLRKYVDLFGQIAHSFYDLKSHQATLSALLGFAFIFQLIRIFINYMIGVSLHINVPLAYYFLFVPVVLIFAMLPLSIGGFGVLAGGKVYFLLQAGATMDQGVGLSLLVMTANIIAGVPGAIVFFFEGISGGIGSKGSEARKEGIQYIRSMGKKLKEKGA